MVLVALIGLFIGAYLTLYHYGYIGELACSSTSGSCERVQSSRWSVLLGLPVATWGMGFYASVLALSMAGLQPRFAESRRLSLAFRLTLGREPGKEESAVLSELVQKSRQRKAKEEAVWAGVARVLLNLEEFTARE